MFENCLVPPWIPAEPKLAVVGQSVGPEEWRQQRPFIGPAGQQLRTWLRVVGLDPDEDVMYTNVCMHFDSHDPNHKPTVPCCKAGYPRVRDELAAVPAIRCVLLVGGPASHLLFKGRMGEMHGRQGSVRVPPLAGTIRISGQLCAACQKGYLDDKGECVECARWEIPTLACWHSSFYIRSRSFKKRAEIEGDVLGVLGRVVEILDGKRTEVELPEAEYVGEVTVR